ncbi:hypothetical protein [Bradyrhizobium sp. dw_78]|uniref:hypothetical protein n=1 Tax=Bradyrhizobium sp. dw_78 TaxID=2719793 RepID=UPI001BD32615|nr:hypothetical protein [Bradyrhizobium sp. dw_78]
MQEDHAQSKSQSGNDDSKKVIPLWLTPAGFTGKFHLSMGEIARQGGLILQNIQSTIRNFRRRTGKCIVYPAA